MSISTVFAEELAPKRTLGAVLGPSEVLDKSCTKGPLIGSIFEGILDTYLMGANTMVGEVRGIFNGNWSPTGSSLHRPYYVHGYQWFS